jgi:hypothetical protein
MQVMCRVLGFLLTLLVASLPAWSRSFPSTPDVTEAEQQRWGTTVASYITAGCWWHPPTAGTTVTLEPCVAFGLDTEGQPTLKGFGEDVSRALTFSGGDGRYWVGGRTSPGLTIPGWTCLAGLHYCWAKSDTPPALPSGLMLLSTTTITAGVVGEAMLMAPLRRSTPYRVPAGVRLLLGVCPEVGRQPLFEADGGTTGLVRFGPGACGQIYPEWWGADPTGRLDSTAAWQQAIDAVSGLEEQQTLGRIPLACTGVYKVTGPLTVRPLLGIVGYYKPATTGPRSVACQFNYEGTGSLFVAPDIGQSYGAWSMWTTPRIRRSISISRRA